ncbi:radical SAM protein [Stetteria hydrogenophila]
MRRPLVGIAYPAPYRAALSSLAYHLLKGLLAGEGIPYTEVFMEEEPWSPGRYRPPTALFASLPYELMYPDMVRLLDQLRVPVRAGERGEEDPVVIAGGPAVTANPLPVSGIVDAVLIGEVEPVFHDIIDALGYPSRKSRLEALAQVDGVYVPSLGNEPVTRVYARDLDSAWYPVRQEIPRGVEPVWGRSFMLETTRGCARGCRFCMEGFIFRPKRDRSLKRILELMEEGVRVNRVGKVAFYSLAFFDNPAAERALEHAVEALGLEVSVPSLRLETLTERRARLIAAGGQRTLTIAPETGSCRVARAINKYAGNERVLEAVETAVAAGLRSVKMYLITGFPGETEEDLEATVELVAGAQRVAASRGGRVKVSVNPFIPKPVTPLQWAPMAPLGELRRRISMLRRRLARLGVEVDAYDPRYAVAQAVIARGGPEASELVVEWGRRGGGLGGFRAAAKALGVEVERYLAGMDPREDPPWHRVAVHPYARLETLRLEYKAYLDAMG